MMKSILLSVLIFTTSFSLSFAQETFTTKKVKKRRSSQPITNQVKIKRLNSVKIPRLIPKIDASNFSTVQEYPDHFEQPLNGHEVRWVKQNNDGVYKITYKVSDKKRKEEVFFVYQNGFTNGYDIFEYRKQVEDYQEIPEDSEDPHDKADYKVFIDVGDKELNQELLLLERNSAGMVRGKFKDPRSRPFYIYRDNHGNWLIGRAYNPSL